MCINIIIKITQTFIYISGYTFGKKEIYENRFHTFVLYIKINICLKFFLKIFFYFFQRIFFKFLFCMPKICLLSMQILGIKENFKIVCNIFYKKIYLYFLLYKIFFATTRTLFVKYADFGYIIINTFGRPFV